MKVIQSDMVCNLMLYVISMQNLEMLIFSGLSAFKGGEIVTMGGDCSERRTRVVTSNVWALYDGRVQN